VANKLSTATDEQLQLLASALHDELHAVEQEVRSRRGRWWHFFTGTHPPGQKCEACLRWSKGAQAE